MNYSSHQAAPYDQSGLTPQGDATQLEFCSKKEQKIKRSRFSEEQILGILQEAEAGNPIKAVCPAHNISAATYHAWKRKFGGMEVSEAKSLRTLESRSLRNKSNRINRFVLVKLSQDEVHLIHVEKSRIWIPAVFEQFNGDVGFTENFIMSCLLLFFRSQNVGINGPTVASILLA